MPGLPEMTVDPLAERLDGRFKGFPVRPDLAVGTVAGLGWPLLGGPLALPLLVLRRSALEHNVRTMASYCTERGVLLAPHGKTTMAPQLVRRQLDAGAWAVTAATVAQAALFRAAGVGDRVLVANEVVDPASVAALGALRAGGTDVSCLVDSVAAVECLDGYAGPGRLPVLVELGTPGGRAGARTVEEAVDVGAAVASSRHLQLAGVECFEGVLHEPAAVDAFLDLLAESARRLLPLAGDLPSYGLLATAGGSLFFDRVVERVRGELGADVTVVLRSGCYLTHDSGYYDRGSPWGSASSSQVRLRPALELWSHVLSTPEPGLAIASFGKRDAAYDIDLPVPLRLLRDGVEVDVAGVTVRALNDQHAFLAVPSSADVRVGDVLVCGLSHPCTAFDKWALIPEVDDDLTVVDAIRTYF